MLQLDPFVLNMFCTVDFAPEAALNVADLLHWARSNYGNLAGIGLTNAVDQRSFITREQFYSMCRKRGYTNERGLQSTFDIIDKNGDGSVVRTEVTLLDKWEFPEWLTAKADEDAADNCRQKLLYRYHGNALLAWRFLNKGGSMRVAWNDFRVACRKLLPAEDCQALPSAWRALDNDLSGWLSLREFDSEAFDKLMAFICWTNASFGSTMGAFPKLQENKHGKITLAEFRHACKPSCLGEDIINFIFAGLDVDGSGAISASEIRFLDQWKASSDIKEEEAWAEITSPGSKKKPAVGKQLLNRQKSQADVLSERRSSSREMTISSKTSSKG